MTPQALQTTLRQGETSTVQFKVNVTNEIGLAQELVAFSNGQGGRIFIGINDRDGSIAGLTYADIQRLNNLISNAAMNHVKEPVYPQTEVVEVEGKLVMIATVSAGSRKPYLDKNGVIWVKSGADKRRVTSAEEISRLLPSGQRFMADKEMVPEADFSQLDLPFFEAFFEQQYGQRADTMDLPLEKLLQNLYLAQGDRLNLGGLLLFGRHLERLFPAFVIKAVAFAGNDLADTAYDDSEDIGGKLIEQFRDGMAFLRRNLRKLQNGQSFNSLGQWEVSQFALEEILQNALIHRDYFKNSPIRLLIFQNRIEIISPGCLPNHLSVDNIRYGNTAIRNNILAAFAAKMLPYRGLGSGIPRALREVPALQLIHDEDGQQFKVVFPRPATPTA